jgi:hypothetical protein
MWLSPAGVHCFFAGTIFSGKWYRRLSLVSACVGAAPLSIARARKGSRILIQRIDFAMQRNFAWHSALVVE